MSRHPHARALRAHRPATKVLLLALAACLLIVIAVAIQAAPAWAGQWVQASCEAPNGAAASSEGWSTLASGGGYGSSAGASCSPGNPMFGLLSSDAAVAVGAGENLAYGPPAGSTLAGGEVYITASADGFGYGASGTVVAYSPAFEYNGNVFFQCANGEATCPNGTYDWSGVINLPSDRGGSLYIGAGCGGIAGQACDEGGNVGAWALVQVWWSDLLLANDSTPGAAGIGGTLLDPDARGAQELTLTATDPGGPGVYALTAQIDGNVVYNATPDDNGGACVPSGELYGALVFDFSQPCKQSEGVDIPIETASVGDGTHVLKLTVTDAAGNSTVVYDGQISTDNAPVDATAPVVVSSGGLVAGGPALSAQPGSWGAPSGAGTITYAYQWQDCNNEGSACESIAGAQGSSYTPAPSDVGHTLRVLVTAANNDGDAQAASTTTSTVASPQGTLGAPNGPGSTEPSPSPVNTGAGSPPGTSTAAAAAASAPASATPAAVGAGAANGTAASEHAIIRLGVHRDISRSFARRALTLRGRLLNSSGEPIKHARVEVLAQNAGSASSRVIARAVTGKHGNFTAKIPAGPSRQIQVTYRAFAADADYAAHAIVNEAVRAGVQLDVTPRRTTSTGTIVLSGRVNGRVPHDGVVVELLVRYLGHWEPFRDPRTDGSGDFHAVYQFEGATGRFPFRAQVLSRQSGFPYAHGESEQVDVHAS